MSEAAVANLSSLWIAMRPPVIAPEPPVDIEALTVAARAAGHAAGRAEGDAALAPLRRGLAVATEALHAAAVVDIAVLQPLFAELVTTIAGVVIAAEVRTSPEILTRLVAAALAAIEIEDDATLHVTAADAALLHGEVSLPLVVDETLPPGEIRIETAHHIVAASLGARLAAVMEGAA
jgi:flagellar biosynthesis/type III secretory pathway protein FliH